MVCIRSPILLLLHLSWGAFSFSLSLSSTQQNGNQQNQPDIPLPSTEISSNRYPSNVLSWLDDEKISWQWANENIPMQFRSNSTSVVVLEKSAILLHLIPTPSSLESSLPPTLNRKLTEWVFHTPFQKIIHLHEDIWIAKNAIVQARLLVQSQAAQPKRIFARKTTARRFNATDARSFLTQNHLWGATKARYYYGLFREPTNPASPSGGRRRRPLIDQQEEELVAVATFSKCRKVQRQCSKDNKTNDSQTFHSYELIRYCSLKDSTVVGGISKLLKTFIRDRDDDVHPMDIVTMVDRDWGAATGWHTTLPFESMSILDPLVMAVNPNEPGQRRYLVGAGLQHDGTDDDQNHEEEDVARRQKQSGLRPRLGLPKDTLAALQNMSNPNEVLEQLAKDSLYPVYDAGVERLYMLVPKKEDLRTQQDAKLLWRTATPKYSTRYYSSNTGIVSLLQYAATQSPPLDSTLHVEAKQSWRETSKNAASAKLIYSAPSSMDPEAMIEVRERMNGWRTMRFVKPKTHKVSSIYHSIFKVNPFNSNVEAEIVIQEHLKTMGVLSFMAGPLSKFDSNQDDDDDDDDDDCEDPSLRFLHFGYGAGTLIRFLDHHSRKSHHTVLELDQAVVEAAEKILPKLPNVSVISKDALEYVNGLPEIDSPFDCICIDVFDEDNFVPEAFYSTQFLHHLSDTFLTANGILVWNFHSGGRKRTRIIQDVSKAVSSVFGHFCWVPSMDSTPTGGNAILLASKLPIPEDGDGNLLLSRVALAIQKQFGLSFDAVARVQGATKGLA